MTTDSWRQESQLESTSRKREIRRKKPLRRGGIQGRRHERGSPGVSRRPGSRRPACLVYCSAIAFLMFLSVTYTRDSTCSLCTGHHGEWC